MCDSLHECEDEKCRCAGKQADTGLPKTIIGFWFKYGFKTMPWVLTLWAALFILAEIGFKVINPLLYRWFVSVFESGLPIGADWISYALPPIITIFLLMLLFDIIDASKNLMQGRWTPKLARRISEKIFDWLYLQSSYFFHNTFAGKINSQANYISDGLRRVLREGMQFAVCFAAIVLNLGLIGMLNWKVATVMIAAFTFRFIWSLEWVGKMQGRFEKSSNLASSLNGRLIDSLSNFNIIKLFSATAREKRHMAEPRGELQTAQKKANDTMFLFWAVPSLLTTGSFIIVMLLCASMYFNGTMTIAEVVFAWSVYWANSEAVSQMVWTLPDLMENYGNARQAYAMINKPLDVIDASGAKILKATKGKIEFRDVSFRYKRAKPGKRMDVITGFNLVIKPGEKVGIVGRSGAGKTTLVNLLLRFYDLTRGKILIDGQDISKATQDSLHDAIAFIPQDPSMFNRKLCENIGYGKEGATADEIQDAAENASAKNFIMDAPDGFDTLVGDRGIKLSGGQRQRIAIARAFLKTAPILVLDEATSALDSETEAAIQKAIAKLSAKRTTIAIAHRLSTLRNMDRIIVMDRGRIVESGPHSELLKKKDGIYAKLWKMQSGGFIQE
ncbi:MAG: ABC transporter ATP-binding protein/permease [Rickettsiales bacterium]|jgi:ABC-type multidrug transport system fused ATPase/permease subunit|nr:ABC transporter ATP-binding protein/permease [Rickettsiales bacterium]